MLKNLINKFNLNNYKKKPFFETGIYIVIFLFFVLSSSYISYPDEFINILAGSSILHGLKPYVQFFDHHAPLAWYLASFFLIFSFKSFILFRLYYAIFTFLVLFVLSRWIKKKFSDLYPYYLGFFFVYPIAGLYYWFHLFLADSLAILFFSVSFWILISKSLNKDRSLKPLIISSIFVFLMVFSSLSYIYLAVALYIWHAYLLGFKNIKKLGLLVLWSVTPYVLYLLYLFATNSFKEFYFANFVYNTQLYISIPNYVRGSGFNPLKFAATLIYNFLQGYMPLLTKIKYLDLYLPTGVLAGLSSFVLFFLLFINNWIFGVLYFFILAFSAPRSALNTFDETDYQSGFFLMLGVASAFIVLYILRKLKNNSDLFDDLKRVSRFLISVFLIFSIVFLASNFYNKLFLRRTQQLPSIYDSSSTRELINFVIDDGDYFWIGPYEPADIFYADKGKAPGKYPSLLPQFREREDLKKDFIKQLEENTPKIIIYKNQASIFGTPAIEFGKFFLDWVDKRYTQLQFIKEVELIKNPSFFDLKTDLYILNKDKKEMLNKFEKAGYIKFKTVLSESDEDSS
ncbi:MAG: hypothetical protein ABH812_02305 [bacterium]